MKIKLISVAVAAALLSAAPVAAETVGLGSTVRGGTSQIGKAIAAFERTIMPTTSRFDEYVAAVIAGDEEQQSRLFNAEEVRGLRLFIGVANCTQCHNGPLLTNEAY